MEGSSGQKRARPPGPCTQPGVAPAAQIPVPALPGTPPSPRGFGKAMGAPQLAARRESNAGPREVMGARRSSQLLRGQSQVLQMKALEGEERIFPRVSGAFQHLINTDVLPPGCVLSPAWSWTWPGEGRIQPQVCGWLQSLLLLPSLGSAGVCWWGHAGDAASPEQHSPRLTLALAQS